MVNCMVVMAIVMRVMMTSVVSSLPIYDHTCGYLMGLSVVYSTTGSIVSVLRVSKMRRWVDSVRSVGSLLNT